MKTSLYILRRFLNEKYPDINSEFYLSRPTKNVHMGLICSILALHEHDQIIYDIEQVWLLKRQDTKVKFVIPQLIHTTNKNV